MKSQSVVIVAVVVFCGAACAAQFWLLNKKSETVETPQSEDVVVDEQPLRYLG